MYKGKNHKHGYKADKQQSPWKRVPICERSHKAGHHQVQDGNAAHHDQINYHRPESNPFLYFGRPDPSEHIFAENFSQTFTPPPFHWQVSTEPLDYNPPTSGHTVLPRLSAQHGFRLGDPSLFQDDDLSAPTTVDNRWAIIITVRPLVRVAKAFWISTSFSGSANAVASSRTTMGASFKIARARAIFAAAHRRKGKFLQFQSGYPYPPAIFPEYPGTERPSGLPAPALSSLLA